MKYIVTGGAGFIGSNLVEELVKQDNKVRVVDDLSTGNLNKLYNVFDLDKVEFSEGDIRHTDFMQDLFQGADGVFHLAAWNSVPRSLNEPTEVISRNSQGTASVLEAARRASVGRVIFSSSSSVYGDGILPMSEVNKPQPKSPYAASKLAGEAYCRAYTECLGIDTIILRYFNVFGPHQSMTSRYAAVVPIFIKKLQRNETPTIYGDGEQTRCFTYVKNVVNANIRVMEDADEVGETFNIAGEKNYTVNYLLDQLKEKMKCEHIQAIYAQNRKGDLKDSEADLTMAKQFLQYEPEVTFEEGLNKTIQYFTRE